MKSLNRIWVTAVIGSALTMVSLDAQTINQRRENQQDRIAQGVKNGTLSAGETAKLEGKEANLNKEIRNDRKANGGNLTNNQKKQINRQQNRVSRQIYNAKHDGPGK